MIHSLLIWRIMGLTLLQMINDSIRQNKKVKTLKHMSLNTHTPVHSCDNLHHSSSIIKPQLFHSRRINHLRVHILHFYLLFLSSFIMSVKVFCYCTFKTSLCKWLWSDLLTSTHLHISCCCLSRFWYVTLDNKTSHQ